jgi:hypothetical protein
MSIDKKKPRKEIMEAAARVRAKHRGALDRLAGSNKENPLVEGLLKLADEIDEMVSSSTVGYWNHEHFKVNEPYSGYRCGICGAKSEFSRKTVLHFHVCVTNDAERLRATARSVQGARTTAANRLQRMDRKLKNVREENRYDPALQGSLNQGQAKIYKALRSIVNGE